MLHFQVLLYTDDPRIKFYVFFFQVYKGLDIITNKVSAEERSAAPHHLLDYVDPLRDYNVREFRDAALDVITKLHARGKLPIIVGGTHYYIESVLWKVLIDKQAAAHSDQDKISQPTACNKSNTLVHATASNMPHMRNVAPVHAPAISENILQEVMRTRGDDAGKKTWRDVSTSTELLYAELCRVDPSRSDDLHPRDRRKIIR